MIAHKDLFAKLRAMSPEEKEHMRRQITGEADNDMIRRGDVFAIIRQLRTSEQSLKSQIYQRALSDVQRAVGDLA